MKKTFTPRQKHFISGGIIVTGTLFSITSGFFYNIHILSELILGLGISLITTGIIDIYGYIVNNPSITSIITSMGLTDIEYNSSTSADQNAMYISANELRLLYSAGVNTLRDQYQAIINSICDNNCDVKIIISSKTIINDEVTITPPGEIESSIRIVEDIIATIKAKEHNGSIELRASPFLPIGRVEIHDDKYCFVTPYTYRRYANSLYHVKYVNTGKANDIYSIWKSHFTDIWKKSNTVARYPLQ